MPRYSLVLTALLTVPLVGCTQSGNIGPNTSGNGQTPARVHLVDAAIKREIAGQTFFWIRARDQASGKTHFATDGAMTWSRLDVQSAGKGRWTVDGERFCQQFDPTPKWKGGRVCRKLFKDGEKLVTSPNDGGLVTYTRATSG